MEPPSTTSDSSAPPLPRDVRGFVDGTFELEDAVMHAVPLLGETALPPETRRPPLADSMSPPDLRGAAAARPCCVVSLFLLSPPALAGAAADAALLVLACWARPLVGRVGLLLAAAPRSRPPRAVDGLASLAAACGRGEAGFAVAVLLLAAACTLLLAVSSFLGADDLV